MFELKTLSLDAVPRALLKAERYRLLNEPGEAESICLDVLAGIRADKTFCSPLFVRAPVVAG